MKYRMALILLIFISTLTHGYSQCPEDPEQLKVNTQEKLDFMKENYPNCNDYYTIKYDNKFIGDPQYTPYTLTLIGCLIGILILLKMVFRKWE